MGVGDGYDTNSTPPIYKIILNFKKYCNNMAPPTTTTTEKSSFTKTNRSLQELLHTLLTRLSDANEIIKTWPEDGDDNSIHVETTTKLIASMHKIVHAIQLVEERVNPNLDHEENNDKNPSAQEMTLANQLRQTAIPLDLLDMMDDTTNTLNPDCFARGLLNEALRQFSNLGKRKVSMNVLASLVEDGFERREKEIQKVVDAAAKAAAAADTDRKDEDINTEESKKRKRHLDNDKIDGDDNDNDNDNEKDIPLTKRNRKE
jgi:hypothetical protein